jgi:hypothetical protein
MFAQHRPQWAGLARSAFGLLFAGDGALDGLLDLLQESCGLFAFRPKVPRNQNAGSSTGDFYRDVFSRRSPADILLEDQAIKAMPIASSQADQAM